jgi:hypothetical protein
MYHHRGVYGEVFERTGEQFEVQQEEILSRSCPVLVLSCRNMFMINSSYSSCVQESKHGGRSPDEHVFNVSERILHEEPQFWGASLTKTGGRIPADFGGDSAACLRYCGS